MSVNQSEVKTVTYPVEPDGDSGPWLILPPSQPQPASPNRKLRTMASVVSMADSTSHPNLPVPMQMPPKRTPFMRLVSNKSFTDTWIGE